MHKRTWFRMQNYDEALLTDTGGRQGCKYGSILFNMAYAKALDEILRRAKAANITLVLHGKGGTIDANTHGPKHSEHVFDATFVDDEAIAVGCKPQHLYEKLSSLMLIIKEVFDIFKMEVNWKPGKTEFMLTCRCRGSLIAQLAVTKSLTLDRLAIAPKRTRQRKKSAPPEPLLVNGGCLHTSTWAASFTTDAK